MMWQWAVAVLCCSIALQGTNGKVSPSSLAADNQIAETPTGFGISGLESVGPARLKRSFKSKGNTGCACGCAAASPEETCNCQCQNQPSCCESDCNCGCHQQRETCGCSECNNRGGKWH